MVVQTDTEYEATVVYNVTKHAGAGGLLVMNDDTIVYAQNFKFQYRDLDEVLVRGTAKAFDNFSYAVTPLPDTLTLQSPHEVPTEEVLLYTNRRAWDTFKHITVENKTPRTHALITLLESFVDLGTKKTRTRFHANPWFYQEPVRLFADASVKRDAPEPNATIGWFLIDDLDAIVAMNAEQVDATSVRDAEHQAIQSGLTTAADMGFDYIQVFTDNRNAATEFDPNRSTQDVFDQFETVTTARITRAQNQIADRLANLAHHCECSGRADVHPKTERWNDDDEILCLRRCDDGSLCSNPVDDFGMTCSDHPPKRNYC